MNALYKVFRVLAAISLLISGCAALPVDAGQGEEAAQTIAAYELLIDKPLTDEIVADFVTSHNCSSVHQFLLCNAVGMALRIDSNRVVETVYLYLNDAEGFEPYQGELPYGLKFYDTMAAVEYKLNRLGIGDSGLPDAAAVPDRMHYEATYHQAGMTIIYNFPFPEEGATIHAIVMTNKKRAR